MRCTIGRRSLPDILQAHCMSIGPHYIRQKEQFLPQCSVISKSSFDFTAAGARNVLAYNALWLNIVDFGSVSTLATDVHVCVAVDFAHVDRLARAAVEVALGNACVWQRWAL